MFLYILALEDECWYVGISHDPMLRAQQHCSETKGAAWTRLHKPLLPIKDHITIEDLGNITNTECELAEDRVTEVLQNQYGLNKVRGGYTIFCKDMKTRPPRYMARWKYNKLKNLKPGVKRFSRKRKRSLWTALNFSRKR